MATDAAGNELWENRFEPFGRDMDQGQPWSALESEMFLRFPGQWEDTAWQEATMGVGLVYNVRRWYQPLTARYTRVDPLPGSQDHDFGYVENRPLVYLDPLGLKKCDQCDDCPCGVWISASIELDVFLYTQGGAATGVKFGCVCRPVDCYGIVLSGQVGLGVSVAASASVGVAVNACNQRDLEGASITFNVAVIPEAGVAVEGGSGVDTDAARTLEAGVGVGGGIAARFRGNLVKLVCIPRLNLPFIP